MWGKNIRVVIIPAIIFIGQSVSISLKFIASSHLASAGRRNDIRTIEASWGCTLMAVSMAVNTLVMGLIILKVFWEVKPTLVERTLGSLNSNAGSTKLRQIVFMIIESGMALFAVQLVRVVLTSLLPVGSTGINIAFELVLVIHQMVNAIIRSVHWHFYFLVLPITFTWLGHYTNNNFGASLKGIVLR